MIEKDSVENPVSITIILPQEKHYKTKILIVYHKFIIESDSDRYRIFDDSDMIISRKNMIV